MKLNQMDLQETIFELRWKKAMGKTWLEWKRLATDKSKMEKLYKGSMLQLGAKGNDKFLPLDYNSLWYL
ncbi:hypothetical protein C0J52_15461 [Blattella germanica]|nr:hypothetical protein C0J52_15461 [Blattella germanica]